MDSAKQRQDSENLKGRTLESAGLVQFQAGAVVSREILREKSGTVTVFAFDKGQQLSEHTAPFDALVLAVDGAADISIGGTVQAVKAGELIIMPAGVPHALKAVSPFKMLLVMLKK